MARKMRQNNVDFHEYEIAVTDVTGLFVLVDDRNQYTVDVGNYFRKWMEASDAHI